MVGWLRSQNVLSDALVILRPWSLYHAWSTYIHIYPSFIRQPCALFKYVSLCLIQEAFWLRESNIGNYSAHSRLLNNFAFLQIMTTRNMESSPFIDWLWGGLNFQIEHHLFPTMPRCNLGKCSMLVRDFCAENGLPYMVDGYWAGYQLNLKQLENVANLVRDNQHKIAGPHQE